MLDARSPRHQNLLQFQNLFNSLSPSSIINIRCVLCSLAEAVSPGCTLMSERTPRDGWKGRLPSPSETRQCQTASYFHRLSLSLILLMQTSRRVASKKHNAPNPGNYSIVPFSTQNLFPQALQYVSAPTSWSTCTHLHSCQSLRPKSQAPTNPQSPNPVTLPTPMYLTSTSPYLPT
jgi:hypothetical protein